MRIDAYKERSEALLMQYSAAELADMVAQAELQIEALTAERDALRAVISGAGISFRKEPEGIRWWWKGE